VRDVVKELEEASKALKALHENFSHLGPFSK
jgi:hypothetical protein